ncbi:macro domain-containing protein RSc0334-like [Uloborus diversus]|uniref:macro domain-containing protein RSc0334-like n=1 Tax=Uloborus diversus TaxID=327109 RepID=UPI002409C541|nr:macro domain-containing protein RSc0334-like [Uloborus diversus]
MLRLFRQTQKHRNYFRFISSRRYFQCNNFKTVAFSGVVNKPITNSHQFLSFSNSSRMGFSEEKEKYYNMKLDEKRSHYACKSKFVTLESIPTWSESGTESSVKSSEYAKNERLNTQVSLFVGDITALEIDAIVNAANKTLRGGGGVDGAIHRAAGPMLLEECITLNGCSTGDAKITGGYRLPANYVIHTVGPIGEKPDLLEKCYRSCLDVAKSNGIRTIAFPCISTGIYGYPNKNAANVVLRTVRDYLEKNSSCFDRVIFCLFLEVDIELYNSLMPHYFPK